jgi:hypothetical protein
VIKVKKIIIIRCCDDCPHISRDNSTSSIESICLRTLDDEGLPKIVENIFRLPEWCSLQSLENE